MSASTWLSSAPPARSVDVERSIPLRRLGASSTIPPAAATALEPTSAPRPSTRIARPASRAQVRSESAKRSQDMISRWPRRAGSAKHSVGGNKPLMGPVRSVRGNRRIPQMDSDFCVGYCASGIAVDCRDALPRGRAQLRAFRRDGKRDRQVLFTAPFVGSVRRSYLGLGRAHWSRRGGDTCLRDSCATENRRRQTKK
jgi:hypothetical protein